MHEVDLGRVEEKVVVKRRDVDAVRRQNAHHRIDLILEEHEVAHHHGFGDLGLARRKSRPRGKAHERGHFPPVHHHIDVLAWEGSLDRSVGTFLDLFDARRGGDRALVDRRRQTCGDRRSGRRRLCCRRLRRRSITHILGSHPLRGRCLSFGATHRKDPDEARCRDACCHASTIHFHEFPFFVNHSAGSAPRCSPSMARSNAATCRSRRLAYSTRDQARHHAFRCRLNYLVGRARCRVGRRSSPSNFDLQEAGAVDRRHPYSGGEATFFTRGVERRAGGVVAASAWTKLRTIRLFYSWHASCRPTNQ